MVHELVVLGATFLLATLGAVAVGAVLDDRIAGFVALYVLVLAVASPILATRSDTLSRVIPRRWVGAAAGTSPEGGAR